VSGHSKSTKIPDDLFSENSVARVVLEVADLKKEHAILNATLELAEERGETIIPVYAKSRLTHPFIFSSYFECSSQMVPRVSKRA
jgi:argininosuccinate lyase